MKRSPSGSVRRVVKGLVASTAVGLALVLGGSPALAAPAGVWVHQRDFPNGFACHDTGKFDVERGNAARYDCRSNPFVPPGEYKVELWEFIN